jgi:hypothetical protein
MAIDDGLLKVLAGAAGLQRALELFPEDVAAAASQVETQRRVLQDTLTPEDEPWPPMQVPRR